MEQEEGRKVFHTGDFETIHVGRNEKDNVEYWFNPLIGITEPFVGFVYSAKGIDRCARIYPIVEGQGIPEVVFTESREDGSTIVKMRQRQIEQRFIDYRIALGMFIVPVIAWFIEKVIQSKRK